MIKVELMGWRKGLNKVELDHLVRQFGGLGLSASKHAVDDLLEGEKIVIHCNDAESARGFCERATATGAVCLCEYKGEPELL